MKDDPAASGNRPDPDTARRPSELAGTRSPGPTLPNDVNAEEWAALGSTREITGSGQMDTENVNDSLPNSTEAAPRGDGPSQKAVNTLGDYRLQKKLGEGAMGVVYKAHQASFNRDVAVKVLFKHIANNPKLVERFYREARVTGSLDHPNIVQGFEVGEEHGWHYFAMEFVDGESLQKVLQRLGRLAVGDAVHIVLRCASGLQHAHEHDVIHRDIKPDNILITRQGGIKIADLGMVKQMDEDMSLTQTGHAVGTPWYMPLEQARNSKDADNRCDIYALGCVLYCLLTGQPPFAGKTLVEVIQAKEVGTFPPARQHSSEVPEKLDLVIMKMTAKQVKYRYANCAEVIRDLENLGLANKRLSFLEPPSDAGPKSVRLKKASSGEIPKPTAPETSKTSVPENPRTPTAPTTPVPTPVDIWYTRTERDDNTVHTRKMTTQQLLQWIDSDQFDPATLVSRQPREGFRTLATYREFQNAVLGRSAKSGVDRKSSRFRKQFKEIEDAERKREKNKPREEETTSTGYWLGIFWRVAAVVGGIGLLYFAFQMAMEALKGLFG